MRPTPNSRVEPFRATDPAEWGRYASHAGYGNNGFFIIPCPGTRTDLQVIASDGAGWEHVSASLKVRTPTWTEMCFLKDLFWGEEETVLQLHPPRSRYVNNHPYCLHLWKPVGIEIALPPTWTVGIVTG